MYTIGVTPFLVAHWIYTTPLSLVCPTTFSTAGVVRSCLVPSGSSGGVLRSLLLVLCNLVLVCIKSSITSGSFWSKWTVRDVAAMRSKQSYISHWYSLTLFCAAANLDFICSTVIWSHRISFSSSVVQLTKGRVMLLSPSLSAFIPLSMYWCSCLSSAEMGLVWLVSQGDARVSASKTDLGSNTGASTLRLGCWPYTAGGFTEATWTAGALVTGGSIAGSLAPDFCCRLACFRWAWCRSHLSRSRFCRDGGFCFLADLGWWVAAICPAWPYCVEFPLDDLCCHWKWTATPFSSCVIVHVAGDIHSPIHCKASASSYTAPGNGDFSEETGFILHWGKIHVKPEGTGIFLLSQKVCKPRMSPPIIGTGIYLPVTTKSY